MFMFYTENTVNWNDVTTTDYSEELETVTPLGKTITITGIIHILVVAYSHDLTVTILITILIKNLSIPLFLL